jgi:hypothetical protein
MISQNRRLTRMNRPLTRSTSEMPAVPVSNNAVSAASFSAEVFAANACRVRERPNGNPENENMPDPNPVGALAHATGGRESWASDMKR